VRVPQGAGRDQQENLVVEPHYLWHVTGWFKYEDQQQWHSVVAGRLLPPTASYYSTKDLVFEIDGKLAENTPIYLYILDNRSAKPVQASLVERRQYLKEDVAFSRLIAMCYAMTFVLALVNLVFFFFIREKPFLLYSLYMLLMLNNLVWQEGWVGRLIVLEGTVWVERALHSFAVVPVVAYYSFFRSYLGLSAKTWSGRFFIGAQLASGLLLVASLVESIALHTYVRHFWISLSNGVVAVGALGVFVVTLACWIGGNRLAAYLFLANLVLISATLMRIYDAFTFGTDSHWLNHSLEVAVAVDAILLSLAVADRALSIRRERDKVKVDLQRMDNAYQREQMLSGFVREAKSLAGDLEGRGFADKLDRLMFQSINRIVDARDVLLLTKEDTEFKHRSIGEEPILALHFPKMLEQDLAELADRCFQGQVVSGTMTGDPDFQGRYNYLLIPVRFREPLNYCVMLLIRRTQSLDREMVAGLREFVEKAVHARMDAENMWELHHSATFDLLTGVYNRATMEMHITSALEQGGETGRGLSLAFADIDHFKVLNDSKGHDFGDDCLRLLCRTMREILPIDAVIGRFGGDEFLVLLPGADYLQASQHLAGLNRSLRERMSESDVSLTVSVGIAECLAGQKMSMTELLKNADRSLYAAKAAGRGQIGKKVEIG
jgi:diguanylate cyclase (GGDEF)-like protein